MGISIKISTKAEANNAAKKVQEIAANKQLGRFLANEAESGMGKYVPRRTGALQFSSSIAPFKVTYNAPYAKYPYYGRNMTISDERNPLATSKWDEAYAKADGKKLGKAGTKFLKGL